MARTLIKKIGRDGVNIGSIETFSGPVANIPSGFLLCDGAIVSRTDYAALFAVIGTSHGEGDGSTTFHLPDLRGRFIRGVDLGAGRDPNAGARTAGNVGGSTGDNPGSVQADAFRSHNHSYNDRGNFVAGGLIFPANNFTLADLSRTTGNAGGSETRPVNFNAVCIIRAN